MTRTLALLGAALPARIMPPLEDNNEAGFWEPLSVGALNDEILEALDSEWDDIFAFRQRPYLSNFDRAYLGRAMELLEQEFNGSEVIVLKDPRVSILTTFWNRALSEAGYSTHYVVMVRNPLEVAESLRTRDGFPLEKSLLLWSTYMVAVERDTRGLGRTFVSYDDLLSNWRAARDRIQQCTGVPFPRDTAGAALEIDRFLDRRLRHHEASLEDFLARQDVPELVKTLYSKLVEASRGAEIDEAAINQVEAELARTEALLGSVVADMRARTRKLAREISDGRVELDAAVRDLEAERTRHQVASAAAEAHSVEENKIREILKSRDADLQSTASKLDRTTAELQRATAEVERVNEQMEDARSELSEVGEQLSREREIVEERTEQFEKSRRDVATILDELRDREVKLSSSKEELGRTQRELSSTTRNLRAQELTAQGKDRQLAWLRTVEDLLAESAAGWRGLMPPPWRRRRQLALLQRRGLFDSKAYLERYPDVARSGMDPLRHYILHGMAEGRTVQASEDQDQWPAAAS